VALTDDALSRAVIADPRAVATRWPGPRQRVIAELAMTVTEAPWRLSAHTRARAADVGLDDEALIHLVALSAFFGHLNRIADAVGVALDYAVRYPAPHAEPATPRYETAPAVLATGAMLSLAQRTPTAEALAAWRTYVMDRDAPLSRTEREQVAARVAGLLGAAPPTDTGDPVLRELADVVTLAPWALGDDAFAALRARGADDAAIFDACVVASTAGVLARIAVAFAALAR
jgi:alkylhydroperoxidase family enzyme